MNKASKRSSRAKQLATVNRAIMLFEENGKYRQATKSETLQYVINYCEKNKIRYVIDAWPGEGYVIEKNVALDYKSHGDPETTEAVRYLLNKSYPQRYFGGPHRWRPEMLRYVGRMMRDYAKDYFDKNFQIGL